MRHVLLMLAALAVVGFATSPARAGHGSRGRAGPSVSYNYHYHQPYYRPMVPYYGYRGGGFGFSMPTHDQAVRRIMATHSRWRYRTHPRSLQNSPPHPYDYFGW